MPYRSSQVSTFSGSTSSAGKPAGTVQNDLLLAIIVSDGNAATLNIQTSGVSDWTTLGTKQQITQGDTQDLIVLYKIAGASEPASYDILNGNSSDTAVILAAYSGVNTVSPIAAAIAFVNTSAAGAGSSPIVATGSSVTTTAANQTVVYGATIDWNNGSAMTWGSLGSLTSRAQATPANFANAILADLTQASAGASGALSATGTNAGASGRYIAFQLALNDATAGGNLILPARRAQLAGGLSVLNGGMRG